MSRAIDLILPRLEGLALDPVSKEWQAVCPAHNGDDFSLSVSFDDNGRVATIRCTEGCTAESIATALGIEEVDLFTNRLDSSSPVAAKEESAQGASGNSPAQQRVDDSPKANSESPSRPSIRANNPDLNALTSITWRAVKELNDASPELFRRENAIVRVSASDGSITCTEIDINRLRNWLINRIDFNQARGDSVVPARPPMDLYQNLLATPDPPLPRLIGTVNHPIFAADATLQIKPGYSPATHRYYVPSSGLELPTISLKPTPQEIEQAKSNLLEELLGDFPFVDQPSRAHALAALMLPFVRPLITGPTPLHLIWKPKPGTGATLLAETLCLPSCGFPALITVSKDEDERRRTILATLAGGPGAVLLDNVRNLNGSALASCLTL